MRITSTQDGCPSHKPLDPSAQITPKNRVSCPVSWGSELKIIRHKRIPSTNTAAKTLAEEGAEEWTVVVSEVQIKGRGRSGRIWKSPKGGLWFSIIIKPKIPVGQAPLLQFLFANALRAAIERISGVQPEVKWPNDLVVNWKKLAGILIETKISNSQIVYAIIGVGLNVNLTAEELPVEGTSTLAIAQKRLALEGTLISVLVTMHEHYENLRDQQSVVNEWWNHCAHRMKPVIIETGDNLVRGKCVGVNLDGSIIVETSKGKVTIPDGTLRLDT